MIRINEDLAIAPDQNQWVLLERHVMGKESKRAGEEKWVAIAYYSKLHQCLDKVLRLTAVKREPADLAELIQLVQEVHDDLKRGVWLSRGDAA